MYMEVEVLPYGHSWPGRVTSVSRIIQRKHIPVIVRLKTTSSEGVNDLSKVWMGIS